MMSLDLFRRVLSAEAEFHQLHARNGSCAFGREGTLLARIRDVDHAPDGVCRNRYPAAEVSDDHRRSSYFCFRSAANLLATAFVFSACERHGRGISGETESRTYSGHSSTLTGSTT